MSPMADNGIVDRSSNHSVEQTVEKLQNCLKQGPPGSSSRRSLLGS
ncbi:MAG TPA: hypothetical protein VLR46_06400 [Candidatus Dormibacteraeota bacterium]|nr:hypothetical protein [Candidatus Dormibacteraeota bacterium]